MTDDAYDDENWKTLHLVYTIITYNNDSLDLDGC